MSCVAYRNGFLGNIGRVVAERVIIAKLSRPDSDPSLKLITDVEIFENAIRGCAENLVFRK